MCAVLSPILSCPLSGEKFAFSSRQSRASMRCLCRPGRACFFLFCFSPVSLSHFSPNGDNAVFPHLGIAAAPGFVHNWLTLAQQGLFGSSLVCRPHPPPNQPKTAAQGRVWICSPERTHPSPFRGKGQVSPVWFVRFFTQRSPVLFRRKRRTLRIRGLL